MPSSCAPSRTASYYIWICPSSRSGSRRKGLRRQSRGGPGGGENGHAHTAANGTARRWRSATCAQTVLLVRLGLLARTPRRRSARAPQPPCSRTPASVPTRPRGAQPPRPDHLARAPRRGLLQSSALKHRPRSPSAPASSFLAVSLPWLLRRLDLEGLMGARRVGRNRCRDLR